MPYPGQGDDRKKLREANERLKKENEHLREERDSWKKEHGEMLDRAYEPLKELEQRRKAIWCTEFRPGSPGRGGCIGEDRDLCKRCADKCSEEDE